MLAHNPCARAACASKACVVYVWASDRARCAGDWRDGVVVDSDVGVGFERVREG